MDHHLVVEPAPQHAILDGRRAAVGLVPGVVHLAGLGGLVAPPGPLAVLVPQQHRVADPRRNRLGIADVQRQARPAQPRPSRQLRKNDASPHGPDSKSTALSIILFTAYRFSSIVPRRPEVHSLITTEEVITEGYRLTDRLVSSPCARLRVTRVWGR